MKKEALKELPIDVLQKKRKDLKTINGIFIGLIIALAFFVIRNYVVKDELDWPTLTITICTIGGFFSVYQELKQVTEEINIRD